jgi:hypothetical protein
MPEQGWIATSWARNKRRISAMQANSNESQRALRQDLEVGLCVTQGILWILVFLGAALYCFGQVQTTKTDIRSVNFLDFAYPSICWKFNKNSGFEKTIQVSKGEWRKGEGVEEIYFQARKPIYGDLNGDGAEEAVVETNCGFEVSTSGETEVFIFGMIAGKPKLLGQLSWLDWKQDAWGVPFAVKDVQIRHSQVLVTYILGGSHAQPAWIATAEFGWNGSHFVRTGISRKPFKS